MQNHAVVAAFLICVFCASYNQYSTILISPAVSTVHLSLALLVNKIHNVFYASSHFSCIFAHNHSDGVMGSEYFQNTGDQTPSVYTHMR